MAREESFFDDLARGLADGSITRGKALRLMGAAVVGGTLGSLGIDGEAGADPIGCKRNGKHCTRNDQCCSLNCSGGSCQAQTTTTTTTTPTTSTSTSTTTTSTSTTTACPPGTVEVGNGACARFVGNSGCGGDNCLEAGCLGCTVEVGGGGAAYCRGSGALSFCTNHADCGPGQFCGTGDRTGTGPSACFTGC
jgi:hypothetical protein